MALEVNSQNLFQNAQFQQFVDFAEAAAKAGKQKAIARLDAGELGGIVNRTIKPASGDWVGIGVGRLASLKRANNTTRVSMGSDPMDTRPEERSRASLTRQT